MNFVAIIVYIISIECKEKNQNKMTTYRYGK